MSRWRHGGTGDTGDIDAGDTGDIGAGAGADPEDAAEQSELGRAGSTTEASSRRWRFSHGVIMSSSWSVSSCVDSRFNLGTTLPRGFTRRGSKIFAFAFLAVGRAPMGVSSGSSFIAMRFIAMRASGCPPRGVQKLTSKTVETCTYDTNNNAQSGWMLRMTKNERGPLPRQRTMSGNPLAIMRGAALASHDLVGSIA